MVDESCIALLMDRKYISIQILEEDSYEKDVLFYVNLKDPRLADGKQKTKC